LLVARTIQECREGRANLGRLALVPTMGALHAGHMALVDFARDHKSRVAVSIFVNPTQFGLNDDFHRYPRPLEQDLQMCRAAGVDLVFTPSVEEMYPPGVPQAIIDVPELTRTLEGAHRPGHFAGVCQVVAKLFNIVTPEVAVFGAKDFQQLAVIRAMTRALNLPVHISPRNTVREPDGLAMSSRNRYLSPRERQRALSIYRALRDVCGSANQDGERDADRLRAILHRQLSDASVAPEVPTSIDYATLVQPATLAELTGELTGPAQAVIAMRIGTTRLIDNARVLLAEEDTTEHHAQFA
jgi:pantoate--beta-alanine ligase